jgi:hypothetical protein
LAQKNVAVCYLKKQPFNRDISKKKPIGGVISQYRQNGLNEIFWQYIHI